MSVQKVAVTLVVLIGNTGNIWACNYSNGDSTN